MPDYIIRQRDRGQAEAKKGKSRWFISRFYAIRRSPQNRCTIPPCSLDPMPLPTIRRFSMKALPRYQIILLGKQRHIRYEQLAQGCCPNNAAVGVEPAASWSHGTPPSFLHVKSAEKYVIRGICASWIDVFQLLDWWRTASALAFQQSACIVCFVHDSYTFNLTCECELMTESSFLVYCITCTRNAIN